MLFFLYGEDDYSSREKMNEIIVGYSLKNKNRLAPFFFDSSDNSDEAISLIETDLSRNSVFSGKKLFVFKNFLSTALKEKLLQKKELLLSSKEIIVFWEQGNVPAKEPFYKFLKEKAVVQKFDRLSVKKLEKWIKKEFLKKKSAVSMEAIDFLASSIGSDLWQLSREIEKLVSYKNGGGIEKKDVVSLIRPKTETVIFEIVDAFAERNGKKAIRLINRRLSEGESPLYILSMLAFQIRNLLIIKDLIGQGKPYYLLPKISGLHSFVVRKTYSQAPKFTLAELKKIHQKIFSADKKIKRTSGADPIAILNILAVDFCLS